MAVMTMIAAMYRKTELRRSSSSPPTDRSPRRSRSRSRSREGAGAGAEKEQEQEKEQEEREEREEEERELEGSSRGTGRKRDHKKIPRIAQKISAVLKKERKCNPITIPCRQMTMEEE
eukprot:764275-Hanusia_phi.AAC.4